MSKLKEKTAADYAKDIIKELEVWNYINENGCQDPFCADGVNMNLVRNHIVYAKNQILQLAENGEELPEDNFATIAEFWTTYVKTRCVSPEADVNISPADVGAMMVLFKTARIASGSEKADNFIAIAGYAACAGELVSKKNE